MKKLLKRMLLASIIVFSSFFQLIALNAEELPEVFGTENTIAGNVEKKDLSESTNPWCHDNVFTATIDDTNGADTVWVDFFPNKYDENDPTTLDTMSSLSKYGSMYDDYWTTPRSNCYFTIDIENETDDVYELVDYSAFVEAYYPSYLRIYNPKAQAKWATWGETHVNNINSADWLAFLEDETEGYGPMENWTHADMKEITGGAGGNKDVGLINTSDAEGVRLARKIQSFVMDEYQVSWNTDAVPINKDWSQSTPSVNEYSTIKTMKEKSQTSTGRQQYLEAFDLDRTIGTNEKISTNGELKIGDFGNAYNNTAGSTFYVQIVFKFERASKYNVEYDGNGGTSLTPPVDNSQYLLSESVIAKTNTYNNPGYTFDGWNTKSDGAGVSISENASDTVMNLFGASGPTVDKKVTLYAQWKPIPVTTYNVTYDGNGATSGTVPVDGTSYASGDTVTVLSKGTLDNPGYSFTGWKDASGTEYVGGDTFTITADTVLYAQWKPIPVTTYNVTYDGNGATSGTVPVDGTSYVSGDTVTVLTKGTLDNPGYSFAGWKDASGTEYVGGDTFTITADTVLYAQWKPIPVTTYNVTYDGNGATSGTVPVDGTSYVSGDTVTVLTKGTLDNPGYSFAGWKDASGTEYVGGDTFTITADTVLYAQWKPIPVTTYNVTYDGNGATSGTVPVDGTSYTSGDTVTVLSKGTLDNPGYTFTGWKDASGTEYAAGATFTITADTVLYAQWAPVPVSTYKVTYDGNGATSGTIPSDANAYLSGDIVTVKMQGTLVKKGYKFAGWNTTVKPSGSHTYQPNETFIIMEDVTLYAQWEKVMKPIDPKNPDEKLPKTGEAVNEHIYMGISISTISIFILLKKKK